MLSKPNMMPPRHKELLAAANEKHYATKARHKELPDRWSWCEEQTDTNHDAAKAKLRKKLLLQKPHKMLPKQSKAWIGRRWLLPASLSWHQKLSIGSLGALGTQAQRIGHWILLDFFGESCCTRSTNYPLRLHCIRMQVPCPSLSWSWNCCLLTVTWSSFVLPFQWIQPSPQSLLCLVETFSPRKLAWTITAPLTLPVPGTIRSHRRSSLEHDGWRNWPQPPFLSRFFGNNEYCIISSIYIG